MSVDVCLFFFWKKFGISSPPCLPFFRPLDPQPPPLLFWLGAVGLPLVALIDGMVYFPFVSGCCDILLLLCVCVGLCLVLLAKLGKSRICSPEVLEIHFPLLMSVDVCLFFLKEIWYIIAALLALLPPAGSTTLSSVFFNWALWACCWWHWLSTWFVSHLFQDVAIYCCCCVFVWVCAWFY